MDWRTLLFSFRGRINRAKYWLVTLIFAIAGVALTIAGAILAGGTVPASSDALTNRGGALLLVAMLFFIPVAVGLWIGLAIAAKRLHDRNKSGVWLLLFWLAPSVLNAIGQSIGGNGAGAFVALIGGAIAIWGFVEIACLQGTTGPNDYGPDPLGAS